MSRLDYKTETYSHYVSENATMTWKDIKKYNNEEIINSLLNTSDIYIKQFIGSKTFYDLSSSFKIKAIVEIGPRVLELDGGLADYKLLIIIDDADEIADYVDEINLERFDFLDGQRLRYFITNENYFKEEALSRQLNWRHTIFLQDLSVDNFIYKCDDNIIESILKSKEIRVKDIISDFIHIYKNFANEDLVVTINSCQNNSFIFFVYYVYLILSGVKYEDYDLVLMQRYRTLAYFGTPTADEIAEFKKAVNFIAKYYEND